MFSRGPVQSKAERDVDLYNRIAFLLDRGLQRNFILPTDYKNFKKIVAQNKVQKLIGWDNVIRRFSHAKNNVDAVVIDNEIEFTVFDVFKTRCRMFSIAEAFNRCVIELNTVYKTYSELVQVQMVLSRIALTDFTKLSPSVAVTKTSIEAQWGHIVTLDWMQTIRDTEKSNGQSSPSRSLSPNAERSDRLRRLRPSVERLLTQFCTKIENTFKIDIDKRRISRASLLLIIHPDKHDTIIDSEGTSFISEVLNIITNQPKVITYSKRKIIQKIKQIAVKIEYQQNGGVIQRIRTRTRTRTKTL